MYDSMWAENSYENLVFLLYSCIRHLYDLFITEPYLLKSNTLDNKTKEIENKNFKKLNLI